MVTLTLQAQATGQQINIGATVFTPPSAVFAPTNLVSLTQRGSFVTSSTASNRIIQPVLTINKTVTPTANSNVGSGDLISYTLVVADRSNGPAYDIVISDVLPVGVIYDSSTIDNGTFDQQPTLGDTDTIVWHVAALDRFRGRYVAALHRHCLRTRPSRHRREPHTQQQRHTALLRQRTRPGCHHRPRHSAAHLQRGQQQCRPAHRR